MKMKITIKIKIETEINEERYHASFDKLVVSLQEPITKECKAPFTLVSKLSNDSTRRIPSQLFLQKLYASSLQGALVTNFRSCKRLLSFADSA